MNIRQLVEDFQEIKAQYPSVEDANILKMMEIKLKQIEVGKNDR